MGNERMKQRLNLMTPCGQN